MSAKPKPPDYKDFCGRSWPAETLDDILADPAARENAKTVLAVGLLSAGGFSGGKAYAIARSRYRREEPAALLCALALRLFDLREVANVAS